MLIKPEIGGLLHEIHDTLEPPRYTQTDRMRERIARGEIGRFEYDVARLLVESEPGFARNEHAVLRVKGVARQGNVRDLEPIQSAITALAESRLTGAVR